MESAPSYPFGSSHSQKPQWYSTSSLSDWLKRMAECQIETFVAPAFGRQLVPCKDVGFVVNHVPARGLMQFRRPGPQLIYCLARPLPLALRAQVVFPALEVYGDAAKLADRPVHRLGGLNNQPLPKHLNLIRTEDHHTLDFNC
jgi:hypothetical protein